MKKIEFLASDIGECCLAAKELCIGMVADEGDAFSEGAAATIMGVRALLDKAGMLADVLGGNTHSDPREWIVPPIVLDDEKAASNVESVDFAIKDMDSLVQGMAGEIEAIATKALNPKNTKRDLWVAMQMVLAKAQELRECSGGEVRHRQAS